MADILLKSVRCRQMTGQWWNTLIPDSFMLPELQLQDKGYAGNVFSDHCEENI